MPDPQTMTVDDLEAEDAKLATLAKQAAGRVPQLKGAAVRDSIGRTYASASVELPSLGLTALQAAVAQAASAGAEALEAAVIFNQPGDDAGVEAVRDLAPEAPVYAVNRKDVTRLA
ncbi:cytidine deaminase [Salininema proteolyticum]|uniref:Cytidine deaminase n=1 Tax=Salininema proteolyticum TaxID=1607685 RepID=A0ABV8TUY0_9ACTN